MESDNLGEDTGIAYWRQGHKRKANLAVVVPGGVAWYCGPSFSLERFADGGFMTKIDPEGERQRLAMLYGAMSDEELQKMGGAPGELMDWAFEALREEMKKRGLSWAGEDMPLPSQMKHRGRVEDPGNRPVVLRRYRDMPQAFVEKSVLEDAGFECFLQDDNVVRMDWLWSNAMGGIKLVVREKDAEEAEKLLSQSPAEQTENAAKEE